MIDQAFLDLLGELTQKESRRMASQKIAELLGAADLAIFVKDQDVDIFIPASGYIQVMQDPSGWQRFFGDCSNMSRTKATLPWPDKKVTVELRSIVTGIRPQQKFDRSLHAEETDSILVFLGEPTTSEMLSQLVSVMPLLASCIRFEWLALIAKNAVNLHAHEVTKSEKLISQLEKTRLDLQRSLYHSQKSLNARNDFLSVASHELKTPLQSIILEVGMLKRNIEKLNIPASLEKSLNRFESLDIQLKRMTTLIDNLLDYSQVSEGKLIFNYQRTDLSELASQVIGRFKRQAAEANCLIHLNAPDRNYIYCDVSKMDQVISNLISNAIKYGSQKDIFVGVSSHGDKPILFVKDQGQGIPRAEQEIIFERFERCKSAKNVSGFGLGLFVVKQIIDGHGGMVHVESEPGLGSTFTVVLNQNLNQVENSYEQLQ